MFHKFLYPFSAEENRDARDSCSFKKRRPGRKKKADSKSGGNNQCADKRGEPGGRWGFNAARMFETQGKEELLERQQNRMAHLGS